MGIPRRIRLLASFAAIAALLFAQLAVSGYACPMMGMAPEAETAMNANLCERHCDYGNVSAEQAKSPASTTIAVQSFVRIALASPASLPQVTARTLRASWPAAGPAPPLIRTTVLRI
jgi:hypothetical protein